jgi:hypothetical protein
MRKALLLLSTIVAKHNASAFVTRSPAAARSSLSNMSALPTTAQVSNDDFMKQLGHASQIIPFLHPEDGSSPSEEESAALLEVISKQFEHSDGIRGFFAVYLTSPESLTVEEVPSVLAAAVKGADTKVMVPLACMNVIMPTAMSSIHQDPELKECAAKTAENGIKILRLLKGDSDVVSNCQAIYQVSTGAADGGDDLIEYWNKFFVNYKYGPDQKALIAEVIKEFC